MYFDHIYPLPQLLQTALGSGACSVVWSTTHWGFHHEGKLALIRSYSMPTAPSWGRASGSPCYTPCWDFLLLEPAEALCELPPPLWIQMDPTLPVCRKPLWLEVIHRVWILHSLPSPGKMLDSGGRDVRQTSYWGPIIPQSLMLERGLRGSGWGAAFSWDVAS